MNTIDVAQATDSLGRYARQLDQGPLIVTEDGHAIAALLPIDADLESLALSLNPRFQALIEQARAEYRAGSSFSAEEVRRELGIMDIGPDHGTRA